MRLGQSELKENFNGTLYFIHTSGFRVAYKTAPLYTDLDILILLEFLQPIGTTFQVVALTATVR